MEPYTIAVGAYVLVALAIQFVVMPHTSSASTAFWLVLWSSIWPALIISALVNYIRNGAD